MSRTVIVLIAVQCIAAVAVAFGAVEREAVFFITAFLCMAVALLPLTDGVSLFIASIPLFAALPFNEHFDSMAAWRIVLAVLFIRYLAAEYAKVLPGKDKNPVLFACEIALHCIHSRLFWAVGIFLCWGFASALFAPYPMVGLKKVVFLLNIVMLYPIVDSMLRIREGYDALRKAAFVALGITLFAGFLQLGSIIFIPLERFWRFWAGHVIPLFYGYDLGELLQTSNTWFFTGGNGGPALRMFSVFPDSHSFAVFVMAGLALPVAAYLHYNGVKRIAAGMLVVVSLLSLILSGSRGVWLAAVGVTVLLVAAWVFVYKRHRFMTEEVKLYLLGFALFGILFMPASYISSLSQLGAGSTTDALGSLKRVRSIADLEETSNKSRLGIWKIGAQGVLNHPILGVGFGNFSVALGEDIEASRKGASAHNLYLDIASEGGIPMLGAFIAIIVIVLWRTARVAWTSEGNDEPYRNISMAFLVYFVWILGYSFFDVVLFNDKALLFTVAMMALANARSA